MHPRSPHFLLSMFKVASIRPYYSWNNIPSYKNYNGKGPCEVLGHLVVKWHLKCLCHFYLPSLYPDTLCQPSGPKIYRKCILDAMDKGKCGDLGSISGCFWALGGPGWLKVSGYRLEAGNDILDAILQRNGLKLATFGMDKGKCGNLGCIFECFWDLRGAPKVTDGWLRVSGYRLGRWKWQRRFRCNFAMRWPHTSHFEHG